MISSLISFTIDSFYSSYIKIFEISSKSRTSQSFDFFFVDILFVILRIQKFPNFFPSFTIDRDRSSFLIVLHTQKFLNFKISPNIENESILRHLFRHYFSLSFVSKIFSIQHRSFTNICYFSRSIDLLSSYPKISKISSIQHRSFANIFHDWSIDPFSCILTTSILHTQKFLLFIIDPSPKKFLKFLPNRKLVDPSISFSSISVTFRHSSYPKISKISSIQHRSFANICCFPRSIDPLSSILIVLYIQKFSKFLPSFQYLLLFRASSFFIPKNFQNFFRPTSILR